MEPLNVQIADDLEEKQSHSTENFEVSSQSHAHGNTKEIPSNPTSKADLSSSENVSEGKLRKSIGTAENPIPSDRQDWNMGFKDATAAAQAAAESAELASMAARAAAQLSIRDSTQGHARSSFHGQRKHEQAPPTNSSFNQRSPRMQGHQGYTDQQGDITERHDDESTNKDFSQSGVQYDTRQQEFREHESQSRDSVSNPSSSKGDSNWSYSSNIQGHETESAENPFYGADVGPQNQPSNFYSESSGFRDDFGASNKFDSYSSLGAFDLGTSEQDNWHAKTTDPSKSNNTKDETLFGDYGEKDVFKEPDEKEYGFGSSSSVFDGVDQGPSGLDVNEKVNHNVANAVFDESGSDTDDGHIFDPAEKYGSPSRKLSPRHSLLQKENPFSEPDLSESFQKSPTYIKLNEPLPVTFDDYDEPSLQYQKELQPETFDPESGGYNHGKPSNDSQGVDDEGRGLGSPRSFGLPSESKGRSSEYDYETYSSSEGGMELNLGTLPGGRRNRANLRPPYTRGDISSPSKFSKAANEGFGPNEDNSPTLKYQVPSSQMSSLEVSTRYDTPSNHGEVISPSRSYENRSDSRSIHENMHETTAKDGKIYLESDESTLEEEVHKPVNLQAAGISRRTKGSTKTRRFPSSSHSTNDSPKHHTIDQSNLNANASSELRSGTKALSNNNSFSPAAVEKPVTPTSTGMVGASVSNEKAPSRENSGKNLGHVHPKLPDFETLTAHLQSLRKNRQ